MGGKASIFYLSCLRVRILASVYLILVYMFGVIKSGAWSDDFPSLINPHGHFLHAAGDGRPLYGWAIEFLFSTFNSVEMLKFIRFLGLSGLLLLNDAVLRLLFNKNISNRAVVASLIAFTLPSFQFSAHWAVAFGMSWTGFFALQGLIYWNKINLISRGLGLLMVSSSLLIYPLMTFFIFAVGFVDLYLTTLTLSIIFQRLKTLLVMLLPAIVVSSIFSWGVNGLLGINFNSRVEFVSISDLPEKILWFFTRPFLLSYRPFLVDSPSPSLISIQVIVFGIILFSLIYITFKSVRKVFYYLIFLNINLIFILLPLIVAAQNQTDIRFLSSNTWLVTFLFVNLVYSSFSVILDHVPNLKRVTISILSLIFLVFGAFSVNDRYVNFILPIQESSKKFVSKELENCSDYQLNLGIEIVPRVSIWPSKNLLGIYSQVTDLASEWVPVGAVLAGLFGESSSLSDKNHVKWGDGKSKKCIVNLERFTK